jgi:hypothetical protein
VDMSSPRQQNCIAERSSPDWGTVEQVADAPFEVPTSLKAPPRGRAQPAYEWRIQAVEYDAGRS